MGRSPGFPDERTVCGLGNRKNRYFNQVLAEQGVEVFPATIALIRALRTRGVRAACVSSSKNCRPVLERAGITDLFDVIFDGRDLEREGLAGKPRPDAFLRTAERLGVAPDGGRGGRGCRLGGRSRTGRRLPAGDWRGSGRRRDALLAAGADLVVDDLAELHAAWRPGAKD